MPITNIFFEAPPVKIPAMVQPKPVIAVEPERPKPAAPPEAGVAELDAVPAESSPEEKEDPAVTQATPEPEISSATSNIISQEEPEEIEPPQIQPTPVSSEIRQNYIARISAAQSRMQDAPSNTEDLEDLLDHAVTLLETVSAHPALRDYDANKRKLDEIEQRLSYGAYPQ